MALTNYGFLAQVSGLGGYDRKPYQNPKETRHLSLS